MMNGISLAVTSPRFRAGGSGPVDPDRYMFFATRNRMPSGTIVTAASGTNYVCSKIVVSTPQYKTRTFRFHLSGFASTEGGNSPQETIVTGTIGTPGNSVLVDEMYMRVGGTFHQLQFGASNTVTIADQTNGAWTDEITIPDVAAESAIELWTFYHTAVAEKIWPVYRIQKHRGERIWGASDLATLEAFMATPDADSTASLDTGYGTQAQPQYFGPDFMVAKGDWDGRPVALGFCDSLGEGRQEFSSAADDRGNLGWFRRWLDKEGINGRTPHLLMGMPGAGSVREYTGSGSSIATRRRDIVREIIAFNNGEWPFTVVANQLGQNDISTSYSTWFNTNYRSLVTRIRAEYSGAKIVAFPPLGRTDIQKTITLTSVGTVATGTIAAGTTGLASGQTVSITGATPTAYNGNVVITVTGANSFTYDFTGGTSPATGTIRLGELGLRVEFQAYSANQSWPADGTDASGKWRLHDDIIAQTSSCCDAAIDTYSAWVSPSRGGCWPGMLELPSTTLTVQAGTDGVATYNSITVADASFLRAEQTINLYSGPDGVARLSTQVIASIAGNVITYQGTSAVVMPIGTVVRPAAAIGENTPASMVHPQPVMIDRIVSGIAQSEKTKFAI
ncbi:SGNH/GDSL hydrolase family protein [Rhizobium hidalgonense]|uniref:SGNH/GDSL hydrolase family protein n=1 Tax=Rhizobium hidalgonense TaxID=1538159 RepID=UPI0028719596|nr:SGNH/GDSL hydrolase family protein [Rhizobium hidalgonense]MDR9813206.1 SGNH/GDSL hydrolase family protein [Rhizobium hidalgonense]